MIDIRLRARIGEAELDEKIGKVLTPLDFNLLLTGPTIVRKPNGRPLCIYRPSAIPPELRESTWPILSELKDSMTANRGLAAGSKRVAMASGKRTEARRIPSAIVGAFDPMGPRKYCRLTAWTGRETDKYKILWPLLRFIGDQLREHVPERWERQMAAVQATHPDWIIPDTPFTTVTVNNTYETGVHKDAGDLDEGFSTLAVLRRGEYRGGCLVFPEYRVAVDMQDGDLLLMDAHEWHGNTWLDPRPKRNHNGQLVEDPGYERISIVSYFRTKMVACEDADTEAGKAKVYAEGRNAALVGE